MGVIEDSKKAAGQGRGGSRVQRAQQAVDSGAARRGDTYYTSPDFPPGMLSASMRDAFPGKEESLVARNIEGYIPPWVKEMEATSHRCC